MESATAGGQHQRAQDLPLATLRESLEPCDALGQRCDSLHEFVQNDFVRYNTGTSANSS